MARQEHITATILDEEKRFSTALAKGERLFADEADKLAEAGETVVPGATVHFLYDTHGFPMDLTRLMAEERGMTVDEAGFEEEREKARKVAQGASKLKADDAGRAAEHGEDQGLGEELAADVGGGGAQGAAQADLAPPDEPPVWARSTTATTSAARSASRRWPTAR